MGISGAKCTRHNKLIRSPGQNGFNMYMYAYRGVGVGWGVGGAFQMQRPLLVYKACHLDSNKYVYMHVRLHTEELGVEG